MPDDQKAKTLIGKIISGVKFLFDIDAYLEELPEHETRHSKIIFTVLHFGFSALVLCWLVAVLVFTYVFNNLFHLPIANHYLGLGVSLFLFLISYSGINIVLNNICLPSNPEFWEKFSFVVIGLILFFIKDIIYHLVVLFSQ